MENSMKEFFRKYWWILVIILIIPVLVNILALIPVPENWVAGRPNDWIQFWATNIGASASALMVYMTKRSIENNHIENIKNRNLQLSILRHQQQSQWLDSLKKAMIDNIMMYNPNHLSDIINLMYQKQGFKLIHDQIRDLLNQLILTDTAVGMLMPEFQSEGLRNYNRLRGECHIKYTQIIEKIQIIAIKYCSLIEKKKYEIDQNIISEDLKNFLKECDSINSEKVLCEKAESLKNSFEGTFDRMRTNAINCIKEEQKRVDSIISEDNGTR